MGLDVSLHGFAETVDDEEERYADYDTWTQERKDEEAAKTHAQWEEWRAKRDADDASVPGGVNSAIGWTTNPRTGEPEPHMFNKRYLRSSYNPGGFDSRVPKLLAEQPEQGTLYWIFAPLDELDESPFTFDGCGGDLVYESGHDRDKVLAALEVCKERALDIAERIRVSDGLGVATVSAMLYSSQELPKATANDALRWAREQMAKEDPNDDFGPGFTSRDGDYFGKAGLTVIASVAGPDILGIPSVHLVFKGDEDDSGWYRDAALITAEFCDEAIRLVTDTGIASISWSG